MRLPILCFRPVKFSEFDNYIRELHKDTNLLFSCQYEVSSFAKANFLLVDLQDYFSKFRVGGTKQKINEKALKMTC